MSFPIIIISGLPGSGKSYLGRKLTKELQIPMVSKDGFKETLFDTLGWSDREWSKKLGKASVQLLEYVLLSHLETQAPLIVESTFRPEFENEHFKELAATYDVNFIQILCWAEGEVLVERFKNRVETGERHPGHVDGGNLEEFRSILMQGKASVLDIPGTVIEVETTDFSKVEYEKIVEQIKGLI